MYTLMEFFRETISRPLEGAAPWNFYTLEIDQGLLAHTRRGTQVPAQQKIVLESITSGTVELFSLNF